MIKNYINVIIPIIKICKNWPIVILSKTLNLKINKIKLRDNVVFIVNDTIPKAYLSMLVETWVNNDYTPKGFEIQSNDIVIDIGANSGFFSIFAAKKANKGRVISFEPVPYLIKKIEENIKENKISNITLEQIAISNTNSSSEFYISNTHSGCHSLFKRDNLDKKITVKTMTLENYCSVNNIGKINLLKLDCEGAEYDIFNSLSESFLKKNVEKISMEYHDVINSEKHERIVDLLIKNNFKVKTIGDLSSGYIYALKNNLIENNDNI